MNGFIIYNFHLLKEIREVRILNSGNRNETYFSTKEQEKEKKTWLQEKNVNKRRTGGY